MEGIIEPVVLVLGHPIAGNPAQFALERAFDSLDLRWRVLSCDVPPERLNEAITGAEVLGFRGLLLDENLLFSGNADQPVSRLYWRSRTHGESWQTEDALSVWLEGVIREHFGDSDDAVGPLLWIGESHPSFPSTIAREQSQSPIAWASTESIQHARLIATSDQVDVSQWPANDGHTLVVDFANPPNNVAQIRALGYQVVGRDEARVGVLNQCLRRWTDQVPTEEVLLEAIEEYLAV